MRHTPTPAQRRRARMNRCLRDVVVHLCPDNPAHTWLSPFTCNDRFCPRCSRRRQRPRILQLTKAATASLEHTPRHRCRHIILTWRPHTVTRSHVRALTRSARAFVNQLDTTWSIRSIEISANRFLHVHIIAATPPLNKNQLERTWRKLTGHSFIVRIRTARKPASVKRLLNYLLYYTTKSLPLLDVPEIRTALKGTRRIATTGALFRLRNTTNPQNHTKGCPCCGRTTHSHVVKPPRRISAADVDSMLFAFHDPDRTLATLHSLHCRDPARFTEKGKAALDYHTERGRNNCRCTHTKPNARPRVKRNRARAPYITKRIAALAGELSHVHTHRPPSNHNTEAYG